MTGENENEDTLEAGAGEDTLVANQTNASSDPGYISDEDFLKLSPEQFNAKMAGTEPEATSGGPNVEDEPGVQTSEQKQENVTAPNPSGGIQQTGGQTQATQQIDQTKTVAPATTKTEQTPASGTTTPAQTGKKPEEKPAAAGTNNLPAGVTQEAVNEFYSKLTGTIKADGREIKVRSADDAIRLIQMGYNYSRRMEELKPVKAMAQMLENHGLRDPEKLNFAIELMQGKREAIQKLLADHKIDALDLDPSKSAGYKPNNYQAHPKDVAFKEAIDATLVAEGGRELITDINASWDNESKSALREQPLIFQNLLAQMQSGVYGQIKKELEYQQSLGYLVGVPFLQAYHQVGTAMQQAGVFNAPTTKTEVQSLAPVAQVPVNQGQQPAPIDTGTRKATAPKNPPAPNVSSISQPRVISNRVNEPIPTDYAGMSDADFKKLRPPS